MQLEGIFAKWELMESLKLNPGINPGELNEWSHELSLSFPADVHDYLIRHNGFARIDSDSFENLEDSGFDFLPFEGDGLIGGKWFKFCEWPYSLIKYLILLGDCERNGLVVICRELDQAFVLCDNFTQFLGMYFVDDKALYRISGEAISLF